jgi:hypothetical protein
VPKLKGPASYFPSIERTYGQPVDHWFATLANAGDRKHIELVAVLKNDHDIGHGHANAICCILARQSIGNRVAAELASALSASDEPGRIYVVAPTGLARSRPGGA